jgi:DNA polymerase-3 subunit alpha
LDAAAAGRLGASVNWEGNVGEPFTHLHVHTEYSMLDGAARLPELVAKAIADGQPALGITDHGNMYGVLDFYRECNAQGIKPIIGTEAYLAYETRTERPARRGRVDDSGGDVEGGHKLYYHLTLLAENDQGYRNLMQLSSLAFLEGYYYKPRMDWDLLSRYHDGLIATTSCLGGHVLQAMLHDDEKGALTAATRLQDIFGRDNLFVELQDHGLAEQRRTNPKLIELAKRIGAPLLATNDSHYTHREDHESHGALLCVQTQDVLSNPNRFKFDGEEHYLKSASEMRYLFKDVPEACDNTLWVAERADVNIEFGAPTLPDFPLPEGVADNTSYLEQLTWQGARERWGDELPQDAVERIAYELKVINDMGFSAYFLIVWDLIRYAREREIRVGPGRGSAAGCAVAYALRITDLDPIRYDLLFERFLNPSRISMPDIDMDFDSRYRDELIGYAAAKYGRDHVAQIITFGTIKARQAVRDSARVLGFPYGLGDKIAKAMPPLVMGRDTPLRYCLEQNDRYADGYKAAAELRSMCDADPDVKRIVEVARGLEGMRRSDGIHAAAVVITRDPLTTYLPVQRKPESGQDPESAPLVTQYEMHGVEELGLLKMDFLGLRNLDVITDTVAMIRAKRDAEFDIDRVALDDDGVFELLSRGDGIGLFQLESGPLRALMRALAPTTFDDVAALIALYRPGPMAANMHNDYADRKNGRKPVEYLHPDFEELLGESYGLMIYQESMMRVAQRAAGYSLAEADNLRKACSKKNRELIAKERVKFIDGCERTGYGTPLGTKLFGIIEPFADYAFNKSHAFGYGLVAYQTAYLKAHYPVEYLACLLTSVRTNLDKAAIYLADARSMGIKVLTPDVNRSRHEFVALWPDEVPDDVELPPGSPGAITFGLAAVRNVGSAVVGQLLDERDANGPYVDFYDFAQRVPEPVLNRKTVESLIKAGAFDSFGHPRMGLLTVFEQIVEATVARRRNRQQGVMSFFDDDESCDVLGYNDLVGIPDVEFDKTDRLRAEKEMLGLYVSDHPLMGIEAALRRRAPTAIASIKEMEDRAQVVVGGVITGFERRYTRRGDLMATFALEDLESSVEVTVFPRTLAEEGHKFADDAIVVVRGRVDRRDENRVSINCQTVEVLTGLDQSASASVRLRLGAQRLTHALIIDLKRIIAEHPGESEVHVELGDGRLLRLSESYRVDVDRAAGELRTLLGHDAVIL